MDDIKRYYDKKTYIFIYQDTFNYKKSCFLLHLLDWYWHRISETTLKNFSVAPMPSQYFHQHQYRTKTNIINQENACYKGITKGQTEFISLSRQIFILKVDIHNTISDTSKNYHKQSRLSQTVSIIFRALFGFILIILLITLIIINYITSY